MVGLGLKEIQEARTMWNIPQVYNDDAVESIVNQKQIIWE